MAKTDVKVKIKPNTKLKEPSLYRVFYLNDDVTTVEFVVKTLITHFQHDASSALELTQSIHEQGSAVVAVLPYEIAEQKGYEVIQEAREEGYPLQVKIESD